MIDLRLERAILELPPLLRPLIVLRPQVLVLCLLRQFFINGHWPVLLLVGWRKIFATHCPIVLNDLGLERTGLNLLLSFYLV